PLSQTPTLKEVACLLFQSRSRGGNDEDLQRISRSMWSPGAAQSAQAPNPTQQSMPINAGGSMPIYRVNVVARTMKAINYQHRSGATKIDFRGTALLPKAHGEAKVESKQGYIEIEVEFRELQPATAYGAEYL